MSAGPQARFVKVGMAFGGAGTAPWPGAGSAPQSPHRDSLCAVPNGRCDPVADSLHLSQRPLLSVTQIIILLGVVAAIVIALASFALLFAAVLRVAASRLQR